MSVDLDFITTRPMPFKALDKKSDYIERRPLFDALYDAEAITAKGINIFRNFPTADVRPVVRAKWDDKPVAFFLKCTKCGCCVGHRYDVFLDRGELNFCPNCGADMREES